MTNEETRWRLSRSGDRWPTGPQSQEMVREVGGKWCRRSRNALRSGVVGMVLCEMTGWPEDLVMNGSLGGNARRVT